MKSRPHTISNTALKKRTSLGLARWIPVSEVNLCGNEKAYVLDCIESGWISSNGSYVSRFEKNFAVFVNAPYALGVCNGTCALHLALVALGIGPGDEVIVPTFTYIATANSVRYTGAKVVFVDSEPDTWNMDVASLEKAITNKTKAIIPVHLYGHPCDMDPLSNIARKRGLFVVEDAAEAFGTEYKSRHAGTMGTVGIYSFFGNKTMTTGEGGMIATHDENLAAKIRLFRGQGVSPTKQYWFEEVGYNYRMTNIQSALGLAQLENAGLFIDKKRKNAMCYTERLKGVPGLSFPQEKYYAYNSYWMYSILIEKEFGMDRDTLMLKLRESGIETRPFFYPCHTMPPYRDVGGSFPVAEEISRKGLNLPSSTRLTEDQIDYIADCIRLYSHD